MGRPSTTSQRVPCRGGLMRSTRGLSGLLSLAACAGGFVVLAGMPARGQAPGGRSLPRPLRVVGTRVENDRGERVRLRGVNAASLEWTSNGEGHILETV